MHASGLHDVYEYNQRQLKLTIVTLNIVFARPWSEFYTTGPTFIPIAQLFGPVNLMYGPVPSNAVQKFYRTRDSAFGDSYRDSHGPTMYVQIVLVSVR